MLRTLPWCILKSCFSSTNHKVGADEELCESLGKSGEGFVNLIGKFPNICDTKFKQGMFVDPQIRKVMFDDNFERKLNFTDFAA